MNPDIYDVQTSYLLPRLWYFL